VRAIALANRRTALVLPTNDRTLAHRTRAPNSIRRAGLCAQIGTYALVALDAQIAGSGALGVGALGVVLCGSGARDGL
jgi:hypothetical protein